ncbi:MAG: hypothetical protein QOJ99_6070 [Bryobacterales bacterium]|nr:hypothetical protein [Bryobacterales bacterium]
MDLLTMCAWTKRIKVADRWLSVEEYLLQVHGLRVTHGICPDAAAVASGSNPEFRRCPDSLIWEQPLQ